MTRQIKFRAWNKEQKVMVYDDEDGSADYWDGAYSSEIRMVNGILGDKDIYYDYIWMQFTGLTDKNNRDVFEGDLISHSGETFEVEWDCSGCWVCCTTFGKTRIVEVNAAEVIGNIHETPG